MNARLRRPLPAPLSIEIEKDAKRTPQNMQTHIQHDRRQEPTGVNPIGDEFTETVTPQILVDCDIHEERPGDGFVAVNSIGAGNGGQRSNLNTRTSVTDDHNRLYILTLAPTILQSRKCLSSGNLPSNPTYVDIRMRR